MPFRWHVCARGSHHYRYISVALHTLLVQDLPVMIWLVYYHLHVPHTFLTRWGCQFVDDFLTIFSCVKNVESKLSLNSTFTEIRSQVSNEDYAIIWTDSADESTVYWRIYASVDIDDYNYKGPLCLPFMVCNWVSWLPVVCIMLFSRVYLEILQWYSRFDTLESRLSITV